MLLPVAHRREVRVLAVGRVAVGVDEQTPREQEELAELLGLETTDLGAELSG